MLTILLHSSKTMLTVDNLVAAENHKPRYVDDAYALINYLRTLSVRDLEQTMSLSLNKATQTHHLLQNFNSNNPTLPALDIFLGDIYSGLQSQTFSPADRQYANEHLYILSGLYGVLKALDQIQPYRLEMGYKLPGNAHIKDNPLDKNGNPTIPNITSLYEFWGDKIAQQLPKNQPIINLSAKEYTKAVFPHFKNIDGLKDIQIISPKFLTISPKTNELTFVTVHAKIARGAYARWLIQNRIEDLSKLKDFNDLGYKYSAKLSTPEEPVFIAQQFKGLGLSVRLTK